VKHYDENGKHHAAALAAHGHLLGQTEG